MSNDRDGEHLFTGRRPRNPDIGCHRVAPSDLPSDRSSVKGGMETIVQSRTAKEMFPDVDESKVMRKIDIRVVPVLCLLYVLAFLDR